MRLFILVTSLPFFVYCGKTVYYHDTVPAPVATNAPVKVEVVIRSPNENNVSEQAVIKPENHPTVCASPTPKASPIPTPVLTYIPTVKPTATVKPTVAPSPKPTVVPTVKPTPPPTPKPTATPQVNCAGSCHTPRYK